MSFPFMQGQSSYPHSKYGTAIAGIPSAKEAFKNEIWQMEGQYYK
ncbi:hypothetical protein GILI108418_06365 [Gillisia limnaea]|uniref:Uncharacterized protein n=1 Tax=Gillisia limnaea (strain DSM 15749 / LMG 21470 / R-8282) TaxID=865937 RepID=H2BSU4_GILLR|nr:hypothetical protein Gilli_0772 [Gillisia limnaea DSM 15749]